MGVTYHPKLLDLFYVHSSIFCFHLAKQGRQKKKAQWMLLEMKGISCIILSLLRSGTVLLAGRSCLQGAAAWHIAPPAHHADSAGGAPDGCPAPSLHQASQGRKQGPPRLGWAAAGCRRLGQTSAPRLPSCGVPAGLAQEAEGSVQHGAEPRRASAWVLGFTPRGAASLARPRNGLCPLTSAHPARAALHCSFPIGKWEHEHIHISGPATAFLNAAKVLH